MYTDTQVINLGLGKLSASRVVQLSPPRSALEVKCAEEYPMWKRSELTKRRWVFALVEDYPLTLSATLTNVDKPYKFALPNDCLRPVRQRRTEWMQRGKFVHSYNSTLSIQYIRNAPETDFDPLFVDVLACRIAFECCEAVTQSNTKKQDVLAQYTNAKNIAGQMNAYIIGPEDIGVDDDDFPFVNARYN